MNGASSPLSETFRTDILSAIRLAPSGDNCQPFRAAWVADTVRIDFDAKRAESFMDVSQFASLLSLGAALENISVAAAAHGWTTYEKLSLPLSGTCAVVTFPGSSKPSPIDRSAIEKRCTNRKPYAKEPLPEKEIVSLTDALPAGTSAEWVRETAKVDAAARALAAFDSELFADRRVHSDIFRWIRWKGDPSSMIEGLPVATLELPAPFAVGLRALSSWNVAHSIYRLGLHHLRVRDAAALYRHSGAIVLLTVRSVDPNELVNAGRAFQRLWLRSAAAGISLQPMMGFVLYALRHRFLAGAEMAPRQKSALAAFEDSFSTLFPSFKSRAPVICVRIGRSTPPSARTGRMP